MRCVGWGAVELGAVCWGGKRRGCQEWDSNPRLQGRLRPERSALDRSAILTAGLGSRPLASQASGAHARALIDADWTRRGARAGAGLARTTQACSASPGASASTWRRWLLGASVPPGPGPDARSPAGRTAGPGVWRQPLVMRSASDARSQSSALRGRVSSPAGWQGSIHTVPQEDCGSWSWCGRRVPGAFGLRWSVEEEVGVG